MAENYYTILTELGRGKFANASVLGNKVGFKYFVLGDGNGNVYNPSEEQTELRNEVWRGQLVQISVDENNPGWIIFETVVPADVGGFTVREIGVLDEVGDLIAVGKYPESYKPNLDSGSTKDLYIKMHLEITNADSVELKIDPSVVVATRQYVDQEVDKIDASKVDNGEFEEFKDDIDDALKDINYPVVSVNGKTGEVVMVKGDLGLGNVKDVEQLGKDEFDEFKNNIEAARFSDENNLEIKVNGEWVEIKASVEGYPVGPVTNFKAVGDDGKAILTWKDPEDLTVKDSEGNDITIARWKGTKVLRKTGSHPQNENDGVLVVDNGVRNQYQNNGFEDTGLANETTYYYSAFPYTEEDLYEEKTDVEVTPTEQRIYGVEIDEGNSNPESSVVYIDDAAGFTPISGNNGNFDWGDWENVIKEELGIRPCVLKSGGGVNYYIDYDDYTKKSGGGNADLSGNDGDVMVEFGKKLFWKFSKSGNKIKVQFSEKEFDGSVSHAFETEDGYNQASLFPLTLTQVVMVVLLKNRDTQSALGIGRTGSGSGYDNTGGTDKKGFMYGSESDEQMKFLGLEDFWGNRRWWIDGVYYDNDLNILIGKGDFNDTGNGYDDYGKAASSNLGGYIDKVQGGNETGFIPASTSGSETTHYADYGSLSGGRVPYFGGDRSNGSTSGGFYLSSATATISSAYVGGRLCFKEGDKLYIGAYLGVEQGGKLRSVSGQESANNQTIGAFRNLAKANN